MSLGFLRAAFRPDVEVCELRAVARQRDILVRVPVWCALTRRR